MADALDAIDDVRACATAELVVRVREAPGTILLLDEGRNELVLPV